MTILEDISRTTFANEAEVETRLLAPLLGLLDYADNDIRPKYPVVFQEGRQGRKPETDFVLFAGPQHSKNTSLIAIEAKHPNEPLSGGKDQGESYAANLRAPFLLTTNGYEIEVWQLQITYESDRVFWSRIEDLTAKFDELHRLISRNAAVAYKESLRQQHVTEVLDNFNAYFDSELRRTNSYDQFVQRSLALVGSNDANAVPSDRLLSDFPTGSIVAASSGYGKTTLANWLARKSAEWAKSNNSNLLAIYIVAPDAIATSKSLLEYAQERVAAHSPHLSMPAFRYLLRTVGSVLLIDGFDRLPPEARQGLAAQVNGLRRDYPRSQIFCFTRPSSSPNIGLPLLELQELALNEQLAYAQTVAAKYGDPSRGPIGFMPDTLRSLCKVPLLLKLILEFWYERRAFPANLRAVFRLWIDELLYTAIAAPSQSIAREDALSIIAWESSHGSINGATALQILRDHHYPESILDDLVRSDALRLVGATVELAHEALGDYLRAARLAKSEHEESKRLVTAIELEKDSLFPVLLAAFIDKHDLQQVLFSRLAKSNLRTYFDALRYRADISQEILEGGGDNFILTYLGDMLTGIEEPLLSFFSQVRDPVYRALVGTDAEVQTIRICGYGSPQWVNYWYSPTASEERVSVASSGSEVSRIRGTNLALLKLRVDSGRVLGLTELKNQLLTLPKSREMKGGVEWISERLVGRIRLFAKRADLSLPLDETLDNLASAIRPYAGQIVSTSLTSDVRFSVDSMLDDIAFLRNSGRNRLNLWWQESRAVENLAGDEVRTRALFDTFYRRLQLVYREVVEHNFRTVSAMFGFYTSLPVRWDLALIVTQEQQDRIFDRTWLHYRWHPVESWQDAGADLEFASNAPARFGEFDFSKFQARLRELGRLTEHSHAWAGAGAPPRFDGNSRFGFYGGETPVITEVSEYIEDDLKRLFEFAPGCDS